MVRSFSIRCPACTQLLPFESPLAIVAFLAIKCWSMSGPRRRGMQPFWSGVTPHYGQTDMLITISMLR
jgi:hypothetical protein